MIEIGTVKSVDVEKASVLVEFAQLETEANCSVLVPTTGANAVFYLPAAGTQVVCWLEGGKNLALGCIFSQADPVPDEVDENTEIRQFGETVTTSKADLWKVKQDGISIELTGNKMSLKNNSKSFKTILNDILMAIKTLTVSTAVGPSGTPLPPTLQKIMVLEQDVNNLLNE
jgi:phage baseplate assembly protein gpV